MRVVIAVTVTIVDKFGRPVALNSCLFFFWNEKINLDLDEKFGKYKFLFLNEIKRRGVVDTRREIFHMKFCKIVELWILKFCATVFSNY